MNSTDLIGDFIVDVLGPDLTSLGFFFVQVKSTSQRDLNFAVQKTIDRLIFLRICEDRGMETYGRLQVLPNGPNIYRRLCELTSEYETRAVLATIPLRAYFVL